MFRIDIEELQNKIKQPITRHKISLGLDIASRTGWALATANSKILTIDYGFINVNTTNQIEKMSKYNEYFNDLIKSEYQIVIEDCYFGNNPLVLKLLAKLEGIAFAIALDKKVKDMPIWIGASSARKMLGCKGNVKKPEVAKWIKDTLGLELDDEDASDAIILAICGLIKKNDNNS